MGYWGVASGYQGPAARHNVGRNCGLSGGLQREGPVVGVGPRKVHPSPLSLACCADRHSPAPPHPCSPSYDYWYQPRHNIMVRGGW
jgi:hypothetical protein